MTAVDVPSRRVTVGSPEAAHTDRVDLHTVAWVDRPCTRGGALAQCSAHGAPVACTVAPSGCEGLTVRFDRPQRRVAPGQTVALYDPSEPSVVLGSGIVG